MLFAGLLVQDDVRVPLLLSIRRLINQSALLACLILRCSCSALKLSGVVQVQEVTQRIFDFSYRP
eukprot:2312660-Amphidinium_carterae.1